MYLLIGSAAIAIVFSGLAAFASYKKPLVAVSSHVAITVAVLAGVYFALVAHSQITETARSDMVDDVARRIELSQTQRMNEAVASLRDTLETRLIVITAALLQSQGLAGTNIDLRSDDQIFQIVSELRDDLNRINAIIDEKD